MKALILVGGFGTRLRPLTFSYPKPLVEFCNVAIVAHQIEALSKVGVKEVILAINYHPEIMLEYMKKFEEDYNVKCICSKEDEPMGTAGPIRLAKEILCKDNEEETIFVLNSDIICEFPLENMLKFHKSHGKEGTILLTKVNEPSRYGVILRDNVGKIEQFIEKPKEFISDKINAGIYILNTKTIDRIPMKPTSIEREIFPLMAVDNELYSFVLEGFWMDIGQPNDYLAGTSLYLDYLSRKNSNKLTRNSLNGFKNLKGNVMIDSSAKVSTDAVIGPDVVIGANCIVESGARIANSVLLPGSVVKNYCWIKGSIIGWKSIVGKWVRIEGLTVLGDDVQIQDELYINGCFILPHKGISTNLPTKGTIIM